MRINKKAAAVAVAAVTLAGTGIAYAYWTTSGTSNGSATSSAGTANLAVVQGTAPSGLAPAVAPVAIPGTIKNNAVNSAYVTKLTVTITGVTGATAADATHPACAASDYGVTTGSTALAKSSAVQTVDLPIGQELTTLQTINFPSVNIGFADDGAANQDTCKGASPTLKFDVS